MIAVALVALSTASVLIRLAFDAQVAPLAVSFWRTALVGLLLAPGLDAAALRAPAERRGLAWAALGGVCLAAHFACWIHSLAHTSVMRSTVLVTLAPVWVGLAEWAAGRSPGRRFWGGIAVALLGGLALAGGAGRAPSVSGDLAALAGGVFGAGYWFAGRAARVHQPIRRLAPLLSLTAALLLAPLALVAGAPLTGYSRHAWLLLVAIAAGPQLVGHNGIQYAMRQLPASRAAGLVLLEPVGATALAWLVLTETPGRWELAGGAVVVAGVILAATPGPSAQAPASSSSGGP